jgi:hypothetical protein
MLNKQGKLVDHWRKGSSEPDISEQETQLWFYFLACSYIGIGYLQWRILRSRYKRQRNN